MAAQSEGERGIAMVLAALLLVAIIAISGIAVEVSRLTDTATEVQVAADAAALAAAQNKINGGTDADARTAAQTVAAHDATDGRAPSPDIVFGSYSVANGFSTSPPSGTDLPAARATVTAADVRYLMATVFGAGTSTTVTKRAVATFESTGQTQAKAPFTVCDCLLQQPTCQPCSGNLNTFTVTQTPTGTQNSCMLVQASGDRAWFPADCPSVGNGSHPAISVGDSISLDNGQISSLLHDFQNCVDAGVHDYVIPIIHCPLFPCSIANCSGHGQVVGFATIHIAVSSDIVAQSSTKSVTFTLVCNNAAPGTRAADTAACFGTGNVELVDDRGG